MKPRTCIGVGNDRRSRLSFCFEWFVAAADDDELDRKPGARERERRREQLPAAFAAGHQHHHGLLGRQAELRAEIGLAARHVVELRMDRMAEQAEARASERRAQSAR